MKHLVNNRCGVCDFIMNGMCHNYEIDKYTLEGTLNKVEWRLNRQSFLCTKCYTAITGVGHDWSDLQAVELKDVPMIEYHPQQKELEPA